MNVAIAARSVAELSSLYAQDASIGGGAQQKRGVILLATSAPSRLAEPLKQFLANRPGIGFKIKQASTKEMEDGLVNGHIDLAFTAMSIERAFTAALPVLKEEVFLAVPPSHRLAGRSGIELSELADEPFINYTEGHPFRELNDMYCRLGGFRANTVCEVDEPATIGAMVNAGLGVAFVGGWKTDSVLSLVRLRIHRPACFRTFQLIWHKERELSAAARSFRDFLACFFSSEKEQPTKRFAR